MKTPMLSRTDCWILMLLASVLFAAGTASLGIFLGRIVFVNLGVSFFPAVDSIIYVAILTLLAFKLIKHVLLPETPLVFRVAYGTGALAAYLFIVVCIGGIILHMVQTKGIFEETIPLYTAGDLLAGWVVDYVVAFILWVGKEIIPKSYG